MPILTKNQVPAKGQAAEFQLDKSALAAVASVAADDYFSDNTNWKSVEMVFKSDSGEQRKVVKFDASQATPKGYFTPSIHAKDIFQIEKIVINDFDRDKFVVKRSELTTAEFDVDMGAIAPLFTTAVGYTDSYSGLNTSRATNSFSGYYGAFSSSRANFYYMANPVGMVDNGTYKIRFYLSELTNSEDFIMEIAGYAAAITKTTSEVLTSYSQNGYVEFQYQLAAGYAWGISLRSQNQATCSFTVSKVEIYPL